MRPSVYYVRLKNSMSACSFLLFSFVTSLLGISSFQASIYYYNYNYCCSPRTKQKRRRINELTDFYGHTDRDMRHFDLEKIPSYYFVEALFVFVPNTPKLCMLFWVNVFSSLCCCCLTVAYSSSFSHFPEQ